MKRSTGLCVVIIAAFIATSGRCSAQRTTAGADELYHAFIDPPRDFSPMPFWFWNGKMEGPLIRHQIQDMVDQHVYGAFLHGRDGLQTPYLSEGWFQAIGAGLDEAKKVGFEFNFVDEYDWPSGEGRNVWMTGNHQSEVLAEQPGFRMKTLAYSTTFVHGPSSEDVPIGPDSQAVVAARWLGHDQIDESSLTRIDQGGESGHVHWAVPAGDWVIVQFRLEPAMGFDGGFVDLMNPKASELFFDLVYGEYYKRFASYFGNTIHYSFSDHEGDYGYRIAWTPGLFAEFRAGAGYDLREFLPLLIFEGGDRTAKVRTDYLEKISRLYGQSFWQGITTRAADYGIHRSGHAWEESLEWTAALEGSLFTVERGLNPVGVDSLVDWGREPLNFKVAQSVADFEGHRFACENQGAQGTNSYLDLEAIRKATNPIGAQGVNLFIPHAFDYDTGRANYPPDWLHQPYWPYFHYYADYTRRISYMNADGHHAVNVLVYYPITSMWAYTRPLFSGSATYEQIGVPSEWKNETIVINDYYTRIIDGLSERQWDYNIADDQYLSSARIEGDELVIGPQRYRAIVLPPIVELSRTIMEKLEEFHKAGGMIFGIRLLPTASPEAGANDSVIRSGIRSLFSPDSRGSFYIEDSVATLIDAIDQHVPKDVRISNGPQEHLYFEHRRKLGTSFYWVVNDTDRRRTNLVHFSERGTPEKWNALTGAIEPLFYLNTADGTDVRLVFDPWDAYFVVFRPLVGEGQGIALEETNVEQIDSLNEANGALQAHISGPLGKSGVYVELREGKQLYHAKVDFTGFDSLALDGNWQFKPEPSRISLPYARVNTASDEDGIRLGWLAEDFDDTDWPESWLNAEETTIRKWQLIGPFPNAENNGFGTVYPPEQEFAPSKKYTGIDGEVAWETYDGDEPYLALDDSWPSSLKRRGGKYSVNSYIVDFDPELQTKSREWIVCYAHTYVYSSVEQHAEILIAADNWAAVWLNQKQIFAQLRTPFWYRFNDSWADRVPVDLHEGWNEILVKVGKGRRASSGFYGFSLRIAEEHGDEPLPHLIASNAPHFPADERADSLRMKWYRFEIPPGSVAVVPPQLHGAYRLFINGKELSHQGGTPVQFGDLLNGQRDILVLITRNVDPLVCPLEFVTGATPFSLKPWTKTGLANFSGTAIYEKHFKLPENYRSHHVVLDLGTVSSVADVSLNGQHAGTLIWSPYRLDISKLLKPGDNLLKIAITNTEANQRAVGTWRPILAKIDHSGMEGPVRLVQYVDQIVKLYPVPSGDGHSLPSSRNSSQH